MDNHLFNNFGIIETLKLYHLGEKTASNGSMIMSSSVLCFTITIIVVMMLFYLMTQGKGLIVDPTY